MTHKEVSLISFLSFIFLVLELVQAKTVKFNHEILHIPYKMTKHSAQEKKIETLENELALLRTEVKALNGKLNRIITNTPFNMVHDQEIRQEETDKEVNIDETTQAYPESFEQNEDEPTEEIIMKLTTSFLKERFSTFKEEVLEELHEYLEEKIKETPYFKTIEQKMAQTPWTFDHSEGKRLKRKRRATNSFPPTDTDYMNPDESFEPEIVYDNDFQHGHFESALDRQLNKLTRMIESELNQYKQNIDTENSAANNELPETRSENIVQSDGHFGLSIEKIFDMLRNEVRNSLQQQSRNVKLTLNKHLDSVETKMTQILTLMEGMKASYDRKFKNLLPVAISNGNKRIEQIETDLASLEAGITSLRGNIISDPVIRDNLEQMHFKLQQEISKAMQPVESEIQALQERSDRNTLEQDTTETALQNFKASMREKVHLMKINITNIANGLKYINASVFDQKEIDDADAAQEEARIKETTNFIEEIRSEWPRIWTNITTVEETCSASMEDTKLVINNIQEDMDQMNDNQTAIKSQMDEFRNSLDNLLTRINKMKQINIKLALEYDEWVEYDFKHTLGHSSCYGGEKYIKKTQFKVGKYVGVLLCSSERYKIFLSNDIEETFLDIGDSKKFGEDHCEFVGAEWTSKIKVGMSPHWFRRMPGKQLRSGLEVIKLEYSLRLNI